MRGLTDLEAWVLALLQNGPPLDREATPDEEEAAFNLARRGCLELKWIGTPNYDDLMARITPAGVEALRLHQLVQACGG